MRGKKTYDPWEELPWKRKPTKKVNHGRMITGMNNPPSAAIKPAIKTSKVLTGADLVARKRDMEEWGKQRRPPPPHAPYVSRGNRLPDRKPVPSSGFVGKTKNPLIQRHEYVEEKYGKDTMFAVLTTTGPHRYEIIHQAKEGAATNNAPQPTTPPQRTARSDVHSRPATAAHRPVPQEGAATNNAPRPTTAVHPQRPARSNVHSRPATAAHRPVPVHVVVETLERLTVPCRTKTVISLPVSDKVDWDALVDVDHAYIDALTRSLRSNHREEEHRLTLMEQDCKQIKDPKVCDAVMKLVRSKLEKLRDTLWHRIQRQDQAAINEAVGRFRDRPVTEMRPRWMTSCTKEFQDRQCDILVGRLEGAILRHNWERLASEDADEALLSAAEAFVRKHGRKSSRQQCIAHVGNKDKCDDILKVVVARVLWRLLLVGSDQKRKKAMDMILDSLIDNGASRVPDVMRECTDKLTELTKRGVAGSPGVVSQRCEALKTAMDNRVSHGKRRTTG